MKHTIRETNINIKLCNIDIYYLMKAQLILSRKIKKILKHLKNHIHYLHLKNSEASCNASENL